MLNGWSRTVAARVGIGLCALVLGALNWPRRDDQAESIPYELRELSRYEISDGNAVSTETVDATNRIWFRRVWSRLEVDQRHLGEFTPTYLSLRAAGPSVHEMRRRILSYIERDPRNAHECICSESRTLRYATLEAIAEVCLTKNHEGSLSAGTLRELLVLTKAADPFEAGLALWCAENAPYWNSEGFTQATRHPCAQIRLMAVEYFLRLCDQMPDRDAVDALQTLTGVLGDADLVVRADAESGLRKGVQNVALRSKMLASAGTTASDVAERVRKTEPLYSSIIHEQQIEREQTIARWRAIVGSLKETVR